jgi:hypothetical protein
MGDGGLLEVLLTIVSKIYPVIDRILDHHAGFLKYINSKHRGCQVWTAKDQRTALFGAQIWYKVRNKKISGRFDASIVSTQRKRPGH